MKNIFYSRAVFFMITALIACTKSDSNNTSANTTCNANTSYAATIKPLFNSTCNLSGCHDNTSAAALNTYQVVYDNTIQIRASVSSGWMPLGSKLTAAQKSAIYCWIDNGAKNN
jgi:hypothetical protein